MITGRRVFTGIILAACLGCTPVLAQSQSSAPPAKGTAAKPSSSVSETVRKDWDGVSAMTRRQWAKLKVGWAHEKIKWADCNHQAHAQKLKGTEQWTAVGKCMMH